MYISNICVQISVVYYDNSRISLLLKVIIELKSWIQDSWCPFSLKDKYIELLFQLNLL